jgi:hypothetical protein
LQAGIMFIIITEFFKKCVLECTVTKLKHRSSLT